MNVVDSSAWLSYFAGDKNADEFASAIEDIGNLLIPSITISEVFKCVMRQRGEGVGRGNLRRRWGGYDVDAQIPVG